MLTERKKHIEKTLEQARETAFQIKEPLLKAEVMAIIAIVSNKTGDMERINDTIFQVERGSMRSEMIAIIAKKLAKAKKIAQARELILGISSSDNYWRAEACARIALYSEDPADFGQARRFAMMISDSLLRKEVLLDIDNFENNPEQIKLHMSKSKVSRKQEIALMDLVRALIKIKDIEGAHEMIAQIEGVHLRARAFADMARILAESL